jgi:hypothetical protein
MERKLVVDYEVLMMAKAYKEAVREPSQDSMELIL